MTQLEKTTKLLDYSVIIKKIDKKTWLEMLPKMSEKQVQTLYDVLIDEVKAWKKEGISIVPPDIEVTLLPIPEHGTTLDNLKAKLEGKTSTPANDKFSAELKKEVTTPELGAHKELHKIIPPPRQATSLPTSMHQEEPDFMMDKPAEQNFDKNAWMLSNKVVVPKIDSGDIPRRHVNVPKVRNRFARLGLDKLTNIQGIDDLEKIEPAHLRQGPLSEQIQLIKTKIDELARNNDLMPINIIPVFEQSPLVKTYLKAGAMLIESNPEKEKISLDEIMADMENAGKDTLSQIEFEAVADLKKELEAMAGI